MQGRRPLSNDSGERRGGLSHRESSSEGKKRTDPGCVLEMETTGFVDDGCWVRVKEKG